MLKWIEAKTSIGVITMLFVLAMGFYGVMMFVTIPQVMAGAGGTEIFDMRPLGYTYDEALSILASMTETAKEYYRQVQIPLDFIYPALMGFFGAFTFAWMRKTVKIPRITLLIPLAAGAFDYLENLGILRLLSGHTKPAAIALTSAFSVGKSALTTVFMTGILVLMVFRAIKAIRRRRGHIRGTA